MGRLSHQLGICQTIIFENLLCYLVAVENPPENLPEKSKNGRVAFTKEIEEKCVSACASGFTIEKCAGLIGVPAGTLKTWVHRNPEFGRKMETARKNHELGLLRDIELAGERSWQAKAWLAERIYHHAIPSSRLAVDTSITHNVGDSFTKLLAGLASRRAEKKAQVIEANEVAQLNDSQVPINQLVKPGKYNNHCATNDSIDSQQVTENKSRKVAMRRRKPRAESLKKWPVDHTPPATPPATDSHA